MNRINNTKTNIDLFVTLVIVFIILNYFKGES